MLLRKQGTAHPSLLQSSQDGVSNLCKWLTVESPDVQKLLRHCPCHMSSLSFSSLSIPFHLRLAFAIGTGTKVKCTPAVSPALKEISPGLSSLSIPESSWSMDRTVPKFDHEDKDNAFGEAN